MVATRVSLESDRSFADFDSARAHATGPKLAPETNVVWNQTYLDVLFEYPIRSDQSLFSIHARLEDLGLRVVTTLRFIQPSGTIRAFEFEGNPGLVRLDPRWYQAAARFVRSGFLHILDGTDHLLFLFCLVIPFRKLRALIPIVTSFTVAHSITLIASAYDLAPDALWFPPLIETLIACSIVYMALENIVGTANVHRRWIITFGFGLVHGFGFSFALRQTLQFGGSHMLTSLLAFNVGVELGQLLVLIILVPLLDALFRFVVAERMGTIILSALVAHTAWHWMIDRGSQLQKFPLQWPDFTPAFFVSLMHWAMVAVLLRRIAVACFRRSRGRREATKVRGRTIPSRNVACEGSFARGARLITAPSGLWGAPPDPLAELLNAATRYALGDSFCLRLRMSRFLHRRAIVGGSKAWATSSACSCALRFADPAAVLALSGRPAYPRTRA